MVNLAILLVVIVSFIVASEAFRTPAAVANHNSFSYRRNWISSSVKIQHIKSPYHNKERHNKLVLTSVVGRSIYTDNYLGKRSTVWKAVMVNIVDLISDVRLGQYGPYLLVLLLLPFIHFYKVLTSKVSGRIENKFPVYECDQCLYQMRPAKDTISLFFADSLFRCPRCGSKGNAFFDIDDPSDPRYHKRLQRLGKG